MGNTTGTTSNLLNSVTIVYLYERLTIINQLLRLFFTILRPIIESRRLIRYKLQTGLWEIWHVPSASIPSIGINILPILPVRLNTHILRSLNSTQKKEFQSICHIIDWVPNEILLLWVMLKTTKAKLNSHKIKSSTPESWEVLFSVYRSRVE